MHYTLAPESRLQLVFFGTLAEATSLQLQIDLAEEARCSCFFFLLGEGAGKVGTKVSLHGAGSQYILRSFLLGTGSSQTDFSTEVLHEGKGSRSHLQQFTALSDSSVANIVTAARASKSAQGADAEIDQQGMLLSPDAMLMQLPLLDVVQHDLQAHHRSTIQYAAATPEEQFYLANRNLSEELIQDLLLRSALQNFVREEGVAKVEDLECFFFGAK